MNINIKKYTKDQMAKMVEDAQAEVQELKQVNAALTEQVSQMNGEAINKANEIANLKVDADALRVQLKNANDTMEAVSKELQRVNSENDGLRNKLADTEAALGRANAELTRSVAEKNTLRNYITKMVDRAAFECRRADYAESHPWRTLWAWAKRKLKMA
jgi:chromosome segregation ATPase